MHVVKVQRCFSYQNRARRRSTALLYDLVNARCRSTTLLGATKTARAVEVRRRFTGVWSHFECWDSLYRHVIFTLHIVEVQCCPEAFKYEHIFDVDCCFVIIKIKTESIPQTHPYLGEFCNNDDDDIGKWEWDVGFGKLHFVEVQCCFQIRARFWRRTLPCDHQNHNKIHPSNRT